MGVIEAEDKPTTQAQLTSCRSIDLDGSFGYRSVYDPNLQDTSRVLHMVESQEPAAETSIIMLP